VSLKCDYRRDHCVASVSADLHIFFCLCSERYMLLLQFPLVSIWWWGLGRVGHGLDQCMDWTGFGWDFQHTFWIELDWVR